MSSLVDLAAMCDARDADQFDGVIDEIDHAPVADSNAALIFETLQLLASSLGAVGRTETQFSG